MKKIWQWLKDSNSLRHLLLGVGFGLGADDWYCAEYVGVGVAGSLEFKDCQHDNGDKPITKWDWKCWDWIDFAFTVAGVNIGYSIRYFLL